MPLEHIDQWHPKFSLPVYTKITDKRFNEHTVGAVYEMVMEDPERAVERGQKPPYNYTHKALLLCKRDIDLKSSNDILIAFDTLTKSRSEAMDKIIGKDEYMEVLVFLRLDMAKRIVTNGLDGLNKDILRQSMEAEQ